MPAPSAGDMRLAKGVAGYYAVHGQRPRNCYVCDGYTRCRCDKTEQRRVKRSARQRWRCAVQPEIMDEIDRFHADLTAEAEAQYDYCGARCCVSDDISDLVDAAQRAPESRPLVVTMAERVLDKIGIGLVPRLAQ